MEKEKRQEEVAELKRDEDVRRELEQATETVEQPESPVVGAKYKVQLGIYVLLLVALGVVYYLLRFGFFEFATDLIRQSQRDTAVLFLRRAIIGTQAILIVLMAAKLVRVFLLRPIKSGAARYNLRRVTTLVAGLLIALIILSVLFADWYTAVVSLGLISLVLGFALQKPITSFIGWIYILVRVPYQVGDRIKMDQATGDVISVSYLDTTLWEFGGDYLSTDHPSGRIIKFPNSKVLDTAVYNYSWSLFPYIWTEIKFNVGYQSDLEFVARVMRETAAEEVGKEMMERVRTYRELLGQTPVDQFEVKEYPSVVFRVSGNTWIEAIVRYLVTPKTAGQVKNRLIQKMLERLNAEPEKVMFPKGDMR
jgi:small-conductance mechanosensitive channel